ncbi:MAG: response regulator, partial [Pyrinomonadaceae bacterium]
MKTAPKRLTVLAVNDDAGVLELLSVVLEHEGYEVITASGGPRALELAFQLEPDIIISDVVMPEVDGFELCRRLKADERTASIPVLLASAVRTGESDSLNGLKAGADDYLEMPFRRQELLVKVARLTERHRVGRHYRELVEKAVDIIYTRDMQGRITSINEAGARFFGRPASELIGMSLVELVGAEGVAEDIAATNEMLSDEPMRVTHRVKDADGVERYHEAMMTLVRDAQGRPDSVRGVVRDITESRVAAEALRESEERYHSLFNQSFEGIFLFDATTKRILEA